MLRFEGVILRREGFTLRADFEVPEGARVAVIGPSGSGKSTLLDLIAGFLYPSSGVLNWKGQPLVGPPGDRPVSMVFQDENLFPHLSVAENVGLGIAPKLRLATKDAARIEQALDGVGLGGYGARRPSALSGGQRSRVALARVLVRNKPLLVLDEPLSALGPAMAEEMLALIKGISDDLSATVFLVSHRLSEARAFATHICFVEDGVVAPPVESNEFFANPPAAFARYQGQLF